MHPTTPPGPTVPPAPGAAEPDHDLAKLAGRPLAEHIEVYQALHTDLQNALAQIDDA